MKKVKLGLCGTGLCARLFHQPALAQMASHFEITAICSGKEENCAHYAALGGWQATYYTDWRQLVADPEVEAILSSYPYFLSEALIQACVQRGKHILVEKPLCDSCAAANTLAQLDTRGTVVGVAENWLYLPAVHTIRALLASGEIGSLRSVYLFSMYEMELGSEYLAQSTWRKTAKGGMILDRAIHTIALEHAIVGPVAEACGLRQSVRPVLGESDTLYTVFRHSNGVVGSLNVCASAAGLETDHTIAFIGTEGTLKVGGFVNEVTIHGKEGERTLSIDNGDNGYLAELQDFYTAITTGSEMVSSLRRAVMDLNTALAPLESPGQWLTLPSYAP
ncbi:MAG: Gfo/Idh/MocA family oxidoreductase [Gemmiger sp.]|nr:Gfo/Idh/MocA family oxidoreductase [Gemmiger sp.]